MAQFRGTLQGTRGLASRLGSKGSGLIVNAASWSGAIETRLFTDADGRDMFEVSQQPHNGAGVSRVIASGIVGGAVTLHTDDNCQQSRF